MLHHERLHPPAHVYPADAWRMVQKKYYPRFLAQNETMFSLANGYLGLRGTFEEGTPVWQHGTFINGFYESWPIVYGEEAFGFAKTGQTMLNVTDSKIIKLYVDDEVFLLPQATLLSFERVLDMQAGTLNREQGCCKVSLDSKECAIEPLQFWQRRSVEPLRHCSIPSDESHRSSSC
jgi:alpha,alpha-trehalose phosphorylase